MAAADLDGGGQAELLLTPAGSAVYLYTWQDDGTGHHTGSFDFARDHRSFELPPQIYRDQSGGRNVSRRRAAVISWYADDFGSKGVVVIPNERQRRVWDPGKYAATGVGTDGHLILRT